MKTAAEDAMDVLEKSISRVSTKYLTGDVLTIADLRVLNETLSWDYLKGSWDKYPKSKEWRERVKGLKGVKEILDLNTT